MIKSNSHLYKLHLLFYFLIKDVNNLLSIFEDIFNLLELFIKAISPNESPGYAILINSESG